MCQMPSVALSGLCLLHLPPTQTQESHYLPVQRRRQGWERFESLLSHGLEVAKSTLDTRLPALAWPAISHVLPPVSACLTLLHAHLSLAALCRGN